MDSDKIIYAITVGDVQTVARDQLDRKLTEKELDFMGDRLGDYIAWYDSICLVFGDLDPEPK